MRSINAEATFHAGTLEGLMKLARSEKNVGYQVLRTKFDMDAESLDELCRRGFLTGFGKFTDNSRKYRITDAGLALTRELTAMFRQRIEAGNEGGEE